MVKKLQEQLEYKNNDLKIIYEMNKRSIFTINIPFGETGSIEIEEINKEQNKEQHMDQ